MTGIAAIPREKACFYWNDKPSENPANDVLVLSFDDPDRDRKSYRFENSTGAPLVGDFLKYESAESLFLDYVGDDSLMLIEPDIWRQVYDAWLSEFRKVEGFKEPDGQPEFEWVTFTGTKDEIEAIEGILLAIGLHALSVSAMRPDPASAVGYDIWLSPDAGDDAKKIAREIEEFLIHVNGSHGGIRCHLPPIILPPAEEF